MFSYAALSQLPFSDIGETQTGGGVTYTLTAAQLSTLQANNASDAAILAAIAGTSPPGDVEVPRDGPSLTDATGGVWTIGSTLNALYGNAILRNGVQVSAQQPAWGVLISFKNGQIKHQNRLGDWWLWNGNLAGIVWTQTVAP